MGQFPSGGLFERRLRRHTHARGHLRRNHSSDIPLTTGAYLCDPVQIHPYRPFTDLQLVSYNTTKWLREPNFHFFNRSRLNRTRTPARRRRYTPQSCVRTCACTCTCSTRVCIGVNLLPKPCPPRIRTRLI